VDPELARTARALINAGRRLERLGDQGIDGALAVVADARDRLERIERDLVRFARARGRSWTQIGADLNIIIPREPDAQIQAAVRYARRRRSASGASRQTNGRGQ
jgi:hypothetical protein